MLHILALCVCRERGGERRTVALKVIPKVGKSDRDVASLRVELKIQVEQLFKF